MVNMRYNVLEIRWRLRIGDAEPSSNFRHKMLLSTHENDIPRKLNWRRRQIQWDTTLCDLTTKQRSEVGGW